MVSKDFQKYALQWLQWVWWSGQWWFLVASLKNSVCYWFLKMATFFVCVNFHHVKMYQKLMLQSLWLFVMIVETLYYCYGKCGSCNCSLITKKIWLKTRHKNRLDPPCTPFKGIWWRYSTIRQEATFFASGS